MAAKKYFRFCELSETSRQAAYRSALEILKTQARKEYVKAAAKFLGGTGMPVGRFAFDIENPSFGIAFYGGINLKQVPENLKNSSIGSLIDSNLLKASIVKTAITPRDNWKTMSVQLEYFGKDEFEGATGVETSDFTVALGGYVEATAKLLEQNYTKFLDRNLSAEVVDRFCQNLSFSEDGRFINE